MNTPDLSFQALEKARALLADSTPLNRDCGRLCAAACCQGEGVDCWGGMLLFPGEEGLYQALPEGFAITPDEGVLPGGRLLSCQGFCDRALRPLACRIFPLAILLDEAQTPRVALDPRAWPICPLMPSGLEGLSAGFVSAVKEAAGVLAQTAEMRAFLRGQTRFIRRLQKPLWEESGAAL